MRISQMIEELQQILDREGDLDVRDGRSTFDSRNISCDSITFQRVIAVNSYTHGRGVCLCT
jgi:hypothetical protein